MRDTGKMIFMREKADWLDEGLIGQNTRDSLEEAVSKVLVRFFTKMVRDTRGSLLMTCPMVRVECFCGIIKSRMVSGSGVISSPNSDHTSYELFYIKCSAYHHQSISSWCLSCRLVLATYRASSSTYLEGKY